MIDEYIRARKSAEKASRAATSEGRYPFLPALDDIAPDCDQYRQQPLGILEIPTELIEGTKTRARQNAFGPNFMPLLEQDSEFAIKWSSLYRAQMEEGIRNPIKVYEYLRHFYVIEGNKRVSVMRFLEMPTIQAEVIRLLPPQDAVPPLYEEFLEFYHAVPLYDIVLTEEGSYLELAALLGRDLEEPWPADVVRRLESEYWNFRRALEPLQEKLPERAAGDAFLIYLRIYAQDALSGVPVSVIGKRIKKIREEILTESNKDNKIALVESPDQALHTPLLARLLPKPSYTPAHPLQVAFLYDGSIASSSWIRNHELGRKRLERCYQGVVRTQCYENAGTGEAFHETAERAIRWGADVIVTISPKQMADALRAAFQYDEVKFLNCSVNLPRKAVRTFYGRMYEAKFLAGVVAAIEADNHKIGYRSDYPIYGTIAGINAFAIGAAMVDPEAQIYLEWSTKQCSDWRRAMMERGIRVISSVESTRLSDGSNQYGVYRMEEGGGIRNLATPIWKWGRFYEKIIQTILEGNWNSRAVTRKDQATNYWWGMASGVVDLKLADGLSPYTLRLLDFLKSGIIYDAISPFDGELRSQDGLIRRAGEAPLTSMDIIRMNWLNENIIGEIPDIDSLTDYAKETVSVSGVR